MTASCSSLNSTKSASMTLDIGFSRWSTRKAKVAKRARSTRKSKVTKQVTANVSKAMQHIDTMYLVSKTKARLVVIHDARISVRSTTPERPLLPAGHTMSKLNTANLDSTMRRTRRSLSDSPFPNQARRSNSAVTWNREAHPSAIVPLHTPPGLQCTAAGPAP